MRTDGQGEANSRFPQFCERALKALQQHAIHKFSPVLQSLLYFLFVSVTDKLTSSDREAPITAR